MKIGFGTAAIGRPLYINIKEKKNDKAFNLELFKQEGIEVLEHAYQLGIRHFDTAPNYGMAEEILLKWVQEKKDPNIIVSSKFGYKYIADFNPDAIAHEHKEHSLSRLEEQWELTQKFGTYLKHYQIHSATLETGVLENEMVLNRLYELKKNQGIQIGITTTGTNQKVVLEKAMQAKVNNETLFDTFQVTYNILDQNLHFIINELTAAGKTVIIKEAMANGRIFTNPNFPHYQKMYDYLEELAQKYKVGMDAIALKFCRSTVPDSIILSGASSKDQVEQNIKANHFKLNVIEIKTLQSFQVEPEDYWSERKQLGWN